MNLLIVFIVAMLIGQSISITMGLVVERTFSSYAGLITFIVFYFLMFYAAWRVSVRLTAPRSPERG